jgi:hypothetical protein
MAIIHSPLVATMVFGAPVVLAGCAMFTTVYTRLRRRSRSADFRSKVAIQILVLLGGLNRMVGDDTRLLPRPAARPRLHY